MISAIMQRLLVAFLIICAAASLARAKTDPADQQLLDYVHPWKSLFQSVSGPLELDADFTAMAGNGSKPSGHLQIRWQSKNRWWCRVDWAGFRQIKIRNGEMEYTSRDIAFTPISIGHLLAVLNLAADSTGNVTIEKEKLRKEKGISVICFQARDDSPQKQDHEFCIDAASHDAVNEQWRDYAVQRLEFSNYANFQGRHYPAQFEELINGAKLFSVTITKLQSAPFDPIYLVPPRDAIERRRCDGMKPPIPVAPVSLDFGLLNRPNEAVYSVTVLADGSVGSVNATLSGGQAFDTVAIAALKKTKFKPAMCGKEPVVTDITTQVNFHAAN